MRHRKLGLKLQVTSSHKRAMLANMVTSLFQHERIETTLLKAKACSREADRLISFAKRQSLHARRQVERKLKNKDVVRKLFHDIGMRYTHRNGGYTRVVKMAGYRHGDGATMALLELTEKKTFAAHDANDRTSAANDTAKEKKEITVDADS